MAERSCVSLPTVRHYIQTLVYSGPTHTIIIAAHGSVRRSTSPSHWWIREDPASTFLFLVPNQRSIKVVRPSSVSPLLVKGKAYVLFSWKSVNMVSDVDFISMSRNGQLIGFCHALPKTESRDVIRHSKQTLFIWKLWEDTSATPCTESDTENSKESEREP